MIWGDVGKIKKKQQKPLCWSALNESNGIIPVGMAEKLGNIFLSNQLKSEEKSCWKQCKKKPSKTTWLTENQPKKSERKNN